MGERRLRVFISSSPGELTDEREAARAAIRTLRLTPWPRRAVESSDVFVGLYWQRYGWKSDAAASSVVEDEYLRSSDVPRLVYVKEPAPERDAELNRLLDGMPSRRAFASPGELAELLLDDLAALLSQRFHGGLTRARDLPEGTVTLVFVDIDGATPVVRLLGDAYPGSVLEPYREVVSESVAAYGGAVVDFEGDGAFCAFAVVPAGVRFARPARARGAGRALPHLGVGALPAR
jgi:hypothetical protein